MSVAAMLNRTCTIRRKGPSTQSVTTYGPKPGWTDRATGVRCAIQARGGSEALLMLRETGQAQYDVFFEAGTTVAVTDRITSIALVSGGTDPLANAVLEVTSPPLDHSGRQPYVMVTAQEVKGGGTS